MNIKEEIVKRADAISIDVIGFTSCEPFSDMESILKERQKNDYLSGFEESDIQKRINPAALMEGCRTIISAGISYYMSDDRVTEKGGYKYRCSISRSSWGVDYHHVLKDKLEQLARFIESDLNGSTAVFVDIGPMLEREAARRAGIGHIGKNCSLINPEYGSYIFLGEILTDLIIELDSPIEDGCGDCNLCIKACPSGALCDPYTLNAKRCISYVTQSRDIAYEQYKSMGNSIYGCDICQRVCPKNKSIKASAHDEFHPEAWNPYPDAVDILDMDNKAYNSTFKKTSSGWRGKKTLQRNAIIALGNSKNKNNASYIIKMLYDGRSDIRETAVKSLFNLLGKESEVELRGHLKQESDENIKNLILNLLDKI